jgi:hypothetical protein
MTLASAVSRIGGRPSGCSSIEYFAVIATHL